MLDKKLPAALGLSLWLLLGSVIAWAQSNTPSDADILAASLDSPDGPVYPISTIRLTYAVETPGQPDLALLLNTTITLSRAPSGFVAPRPDDTLQMKLADVGTLGLSSFHGSAIRAICAQVVEHINNLGFVGVYVRPDPQEIDDSGADLRTGNDKSLMLLIHTAVVVQQRTIAQGERVDPHNGINNPLHEHTIDYSPLDTGDLIDKKALDRYTYWLSRHPGRRVDIALGTSSTPGGAVVDYIVSESKPWSVYFQVANNGTESTGEWRQRLGFVHNQLTNNDDIFRLDLITNALDGTNSVISSYEAPIFDMRRWRWRMHGGWSQFDAQDFGITDSDRFEGEQWWFGNDLVVNVFQYDQLFIDVVGGAKFQKISVDNFFSNTFGETTFLLPHAGLNLERATDLAVTAASVDVQMNLPELGNTDEDELVKLGRTGVESEFMILTWSAYQSFFLEPLLWRRGWADPSTPGDSTLAHEIALQVRGQYSFGDRLAPQFEGVAGGMYTVRGYDESIAAGDSTIIFTAEYRLHIPRLFAIDSDPYDTMVLGKPFRWAPQEVYGRPDWDLIFRGFFDFAQTYIEQPLDVESEDTLMGAGVGAELSFRQNVNVRADYGWALEDVDEVQKGDAKLHLSATILY